MSRRRYLGVLLFELGWLGLASGAARADEPGSQFFDAKGVKIHFLVQGKGEPVVLIHGMHSSAEINWKLPGIIAELAKDHQVIALDLPGHGRSDKPEGDEAYGLRMVDDILLLLDHLSIQKAHVVGYSAGGMVALKFLAMHPERAISGTIAGMGWFREGSRLQNVWDRLPSRESARVPPAFTKNISKLAISESDLKKINLPVKVIVGDRDPVKRLYVVPLQRARGDWPVVEIEDAGHLNCIVKQPFRREVATWIRQNSGK